MQSPLFTISTEAFCFGARFHPTEPLLACATITGEVELHRYDAELGEGASSADEAPADSAPAKPPELVRKMAYHAASCRAAHFLSEGKVKPSRLATVSADCFTAVADVQQGKRVWRAKLSAAGNALLPLGVSTFVVGDDDGCVAIYDVRKKKPTVIWSENSDYISDMARGADDFSLCVTAGDGTLAVYDMRKPGTKGLIAMSDFQEDEFLSLAVVKGGRKVVCGSQGGVMCVFNWGDFGDHKARIKGHPMSVDAIVKISEDAVLTGSSDGRIRVVALQSREVGSCIVGLLGEHCDNGAGAEVYPLESLALSPDEGLLASTSHGQPSVCVWSTQPAHTRLEQVEKDASVVLEPEGAGRADAGEGVEDSDDSDDSDAPRKRKKRRKGFTKLAAKAASRKVGNFFSDL